MRRGLTLLEVVVGALCLGMLMVPVLGFTRTTRELSRLRMVQLTAVRELHGTLDLLSALPLSTLARPVTGLNDLDGSPLDRLLDGRAAPDRRALIADLTGDPELTRTASFEPVREHPQLYRLVVTVSYRSHPGSDEPWQSVTGERLLWRKL